VDDRQRNKAGRTRRQAGRQAGEPFRDLGTSLYTTMAYGLTVPAPSSMAVQRTGTVQTVHTLQSPCVHTVRTIDDLGLGRTHFVFTVAVAPVLSWVPGRHLTTA